MTDGTHTYQWDAEGRLSWVDSGSLDTIAYNALGQWVYWGTGNASQYIYDSAGNDIAYYVPGYGWLNRMIPFQGRTLALYPNDGNTYYWHYNALGSTTLGTDYNGGANGDPLFYPWGQAWGQQGLFAGFSDLENRANLFFGRHRTYNYNISRWLTPDPDNAGADLSNPQSWNAYSYAGNNPTTNTDPSGEDYKVCLTDELGQSHCTNIENESQFQSFLADPGPGYKISGNSLSGNIALTNLLTGQQTLEGTYEQVPGPGSEGGGLQNDVGADLFIGGGIGVAFKAVGGALEAGASAVGRMLGVGGGEEGAVAVAEGEAAASAPVGMRGSPLQVVAGTNADQVIDGISYSGHAIDEMQSEGITPSVVKDAVENGSKVPSYGDRVAHFGDGVKVVTDRTRKVITVMLESR